MEEVKETSFEGSLKALEEAVERLESGNLPLGDALKYFEAGLKASNVCRERLEEFPVQFQVNGFRPRS